jgi:phosphatidyl-myo-inositol alpha-mannosyltransferase
MKIGFVCPYDWSVPGGVQAHIADLALELMERGHEVNVLTPASDTSNLPFWVTAGGEPVAVSYNGSVARLTFGFRPTRRVQAWLKNGKFDVLHIHEPLTPSLSALACWAASGPIVATFHSSMDRSRMLSAGYGLAQTVLEKVTCRIAVSELARNTLVQHVGGDAVLIPNGIHVSNFENVQPLDGKRFDNRIAFLGRFDEPRKGFSILLDACEKLIEEFPDLEIVVAGPGEEEKAKQSLPSVLKSNVRFLGRVSDKEKAAMLRSASVYVAPNTGGESFGIVLLEAMACKTPVIASDLPAFNRVLNYGVAGMPFENQNSDDLARALREVLSNAKLREKMAVAGFDRVQLFDWNKVAADLLDVYETATATGIRVRENLRAQLLGRLSRR